MIDLTREAYKAVQRAFASHPRPTEIPHCMQCFDDAEITRFLAIPDELLTWDDFAMLLFKFFICWGDWIEISYYVPILLKLCERCDSLENELLFSKLLIALRPELHTFAYDIGGRMTEDERRSVFGYIATVLENHLNHAGNEDMTEEMTVTLSFVAAFDTPIAPLLERLASSPVASVRANLALFIGKHAESLALFTNDYLDRYSLLPENEAALRQYLSASFVADYLLANTEAVDAFGEASRVERDVAFDWAVQFERNARLAANPAPNKTEETP